ncbi:diacylglycerol kinase family lipid kinase [Candidatus Gracilibacteria bacterium]|nr:diacylglycerol kinase family lipid kinase [Candidatus Gracilibacteria bacterium]
MRTLIIFNPLAGQAELLERELDYATDIWRAHGWSVERRPTRSAGDGTALAREAVDQGFELVVAAGGDGTINEVINGLAFTKTVLATLPLGTMNVWARELGMPLQPSAAATTLLDCSVHAIDLGRVGERYFLLMAGIGLDAAITASLDSQQKRRLGALAYVLRGTQLAFGIRGTRTRIVLDGKQLRRRVLQLVIGNSQLYGGLVKITDKAHINDGLLDICVLRGDNVWNAIQHTIAILRQRHTYDPHIDYYRARTIDVIAYPRLAVQVDGDPIGFTPVSIQVVPGALLALIPNQLPDNALLTLDIAAKSAAVLDR